MFLLRLDNSSLLAHILRPLEISNILHVCVSADGIQFSAQKSKSIQAQTFLSRQKLLEFQFNPHSPSSTSSSSNTTETAFSIESSTLVKFLDLYGHAFSNDTKSNKYQQQIETTAVQISMGEDGIEVVLEDDGVISLCKLAILENDLATFMDFNSSETISKVILKGSDLLNSLRDIGEVKALDFSFSRTEPNFTLTGHACTGSTEVTFDRGSEVLEFFEYDDSIEQDVTSVSFNLNLLPLQKSLPMASKCSIRLNRDLILCIQLMIPLSSKDNFNFVEYLCMPLVNEDDQD